MSEALYERTLARLIHEARDEIVHQLAQGVPKDYADYRERVGMVKGMETALAKMTETRETLYGKEKDKT